MRKVWKYALMVAVAGVSFTSCSKDDDDDEGNGNKEIPLTQSEMLGEWDFTAYETTSTLEYMGSTHTTESESIDIDGTFTFSVDGSDQILEVDYEMELEITNYADGVEVFTTTETFLIQETGEWEVSDNTLFIKNVSQGDGEFKIEEKTSSKLVLVYEDTIEDQGQEVDVLARLTLTK